MKKFLKDNFVTIIFILIILGGFKSCSDSRRLTEIEKTIQITKDSTDKQMLILFEMVDLRIRIEGLNNEDRFIQATDRKILDVNRQTQIQKDKSALLNDYQILKRKIESTN
jgi:hypothetical protein